MIIKLNVDGREITWVENREVTDLSPQEWTEEVFTLLRRVIERTMWKETGVELERATPADLDEMKGALAR